jgi:hypothetical protein
MQWEVEYTDEFGAWWESLTAEERDAIAYSIGLLEQHGPNLGYPHCSDVYGSKFGNMRELRSQCKGNPYRTFYAFDPLRKAILLIGGEKTGKDRFYKTMVPLADSIFTDYLKEIEEENK